MRSMEQMDLFSRPTTSGKLKLVKFNNGKGALLCNYCRQIIAEGFDHEDKLHACGYCKPLLDQGKFISYETGDGTCHSTQQK